MDKLFAFYDNYTIWQLSRNNLRELAKFVVQENYKHHVKDCSSHFIEADVEAVYQEELRYYNHSHTFIGRYGLMLFKLLLLYAIYPICDRKNGIVFAECDSKLFWTLRLMGIQMHQLGEGINYLGSETFPIYSNYDDLSIFFSC